MIFVIPNILVWETLKKHGMCGLPQILATQNWYVLWLLLLAASTKLQLTKNIYYFTSLNKDCWNSWYKYVMYIYSLFLFAKKKTCFNKFCCTSKTPSFEISGDFLSFDLSFTKTPRNIFPMAFQSGPSSEIVVSWWSVRRYATPPSRNKLEATKAQISGFAEYFWSEGTEGTVVFHGNRKKKHEVSQGCSQKIAGWREFISNEIMLIC